MSHYFHRMTIATLIGLAALSASAQSLDDGAPLAAVAAATPQMSVAPPAPAPALAGRTLVTKDVLRDLGSSANRDWKTHTMGREYKEDFDCPMSFAFAGELHANGYKGLKLFGTTVPLNKPADSAH